MGIMDTLKGRGLLAGILFVSFFLAYVFDRYYIMGEGVSALFSMVDAIL